MLNDRICCSLYCNSLSSLRAPERVLVDVYTATLTLICCAQVESVARACDAFLKQHLLQPTNCISLRTFAEQHGRQDLVRHADNFIAENFQVPPTLRVATAFSFSFVRVGCLVMSCPCRYPQLHLLLVIAHALALTLHVQCSRTGTCNSCRRRVLA